jgi:hypothetical protein
LHSGHIFAKVEERHRGEEFIARVKHLDEYHPGEPIIRVALDNASNHISKQTMAYLAALSGSSSTFTHPAWPLAQSDRVRLPQDGPHSPAPHPSQIDR